jgi:hypothetical protein
MTVPYLPREACIGLSAGAGRVVKSSQANSRKAYVFQVVSLKIGGSGSYFR